MSRNTALVWTRPTHVLLTQTHRFSLSLASKNTDSLSFELMPVISRNCCVPIAQRLTQAENVQVLRLPTVLGVRVK